jgi:uncharacterized membrane protein
VDPALGEWLNLLLRWFHVFAGILWIGQTWLFTWFEAHFEGPVPPRANVSGELWMVHSGGFYVVEKQKTPELLPRTLHWFRWEAALTWLSGLGLLLLVYYAGGLLVDERVADISVATAAAVGLGLLVVAWFVYDALCRTALGRSEAGLAVTGFLLIVAVAFGLTRVLSGRAAYMHVGAMLGTLMAANVWVRILPAQRRMIAAREGGAAPDLALGEQAKLRSKHNTFMVVPLVLIMISNHFPTISYGHRHNWLMLALFVLLGFGAAKLARER